MLRESISTAFAIDVWQHRGVAISTALIVSGGDERLSHPVLMLVTEQAQISGDRRALHVAAGENNREVFQ
jgi:hypothetical protein